MLGCGSSLQIKVTTVLKIVYIVFILARAKVKSKSNTAV